MCCVYCLHCLASSQQRSVSALLVCVPAESDMSSMLSALHQRPRLQLSRSCFTLLHRRVPSARRTHGITWELVVTDRCIDMLIHTMQCVSVRTAYKPQHRGEEGFYSKCCYEAGLTTPGQQPYNNNASCRPCQVRQPLSARQRCCATSAAQGLFSRRGQLGRKSPGTRTCCRPCWPQSTR